MKKIFPVLTLLLVGLLGCKKDKVNTDFDMSYKKWTTFKGQSNNSYSYVAYRIYTLGIVLKQKSQLETER